MSKKRAPGRSLDEWMELVTECRQSGLTDAVWCNEHGIAPSCFYNAVTRLRAMKGSVPNASNTTWFNDFTYSFGYPLLILADSLAESMLVEGLKNLLHYNILLNKITDSWR